MEFPILVLLKGTSKAKVLVFLKREKIQQNLLWYQELPDGWCYAWVACNTPDGDVGYLGSCPRVWNEAITNNLSPHHAKVSKMQISTVIPLRNKTGGAKTMTWDQYNDKIMQVKAFVTVSDTLQGTPTNEWVITLVRQVNSHLNESKSWIWWKSI